MGADSKSRFMMYCSKTRLIEVHLTEEKLTDLILSAVTSLPNSVDLTRYSASFNSVQRLTLPLSYTERSTPLRGTGVIIVLTVKGLNSEFSEASVRRSSIGNEDINGRLREFLCKVRFTIGIESSRGEDFILNASKRESTFFTPPRDTSVALLP